jgi:SAM-dependent methyltransferase
MSETKMISVARSVLDVCCGSKMFWFDSNDGRAIFVDKRRETHSLKDRSSKGGRRKLVINPDIVADFTALPFESETYPLVVFDPPHLVNAGPGSWMAKKYGKLEGDWKKELRKGFSECWRVLKVEGTLVFKWNETQVPVSEIIPLAPVRPLFGQRCGKSARTHWMIFLKQNTKSQSPEERGSTARDGSEF